MKKLNLEYVAHVGYDPKDTEALAIKINELIDSHNRLEEAVRYLANVLPDDYAYEPIQERLNQILKG